MTALRISLVLISFLLVAFSSTANESYVLNARDSLRTKTVEGKRFLMHKVVAKETWTSIAKKYGIKIQDLMDANKGVSTLKTNQIIQVPVKENAAATEPVANSGNPKSNAKEEVEKSSGGVNADSKSVRTPVYHTVKKGESLFGIAKKYGADINDIKKWNDIKSSNIAIGKKLIVKYNEKTVAASDKSPNTSEANLIKVEPGVNTGTGSRDEAAGSNATDETKIPAVEKKEYLKTTSSGKTVNQITETGEASWVNDADLNPNKYYALHRTAPIGTIAKITNRMNSKTVFVKVIGRLPNTGDNFNMLIKISKAAADKLGVIDEHFQAEISYAAAE